MFYNVNLSALAKNAVKYSVLSHLVDKQSILSRNRVLWIINRAFKVIFSMFSKLTPCSPILDGRIPQFVEPWWLDPEYWYFPIYLLLSDGLWHVANIRIQTPEQSKQALSYFPINFGPEENITSVNIQLKRVICRFKKHCFYNERLNSFLSEKRVWRLENVISLFFLLEMAKSDKSYWKKGFEDKKMWFLHFFLGNQILLKRGLKGRKCDFFNLSYLISLLWKIQRPNETNPTGINSYFTIIHNSRHPSYL